MNQINWDGLVLYNNEHSMFLVSVCTPSPEVAVAPARPYSGKPYYDHYDDAEIIICSSDWTGDRDIQIKIPQVGLFDPKIIKKPSENSGFHPFCEEKSPDSSTSHPMKNARRTDRLDDP